MTDASKKWDVAISFASADEPLALQLRDLLQPPHSVFVYSKEQERLAGKDGIEAFRTAFREQATLVVILYAEPWGQTPWTRVEKTAIEELALDQGWDHLLFVRLKGAEPVPKWVPKPHLYLDYATFGMSELAGAIKLRLAELGVESKPLSPAVRAAAQERRRAFDAETATLLANPPRIFAEITNELFEALRVEAAAISTETGWPVNCGPAAFMGGFAVTAQQQSIQIVSGRRALNSMDDTYLALNEFDEPLAIAQPGVGYGYRIPVREPRSVKTRKIQIRRLPDLGWCWELDNRVLPIAGAAQAVIHVLLDRIDYRSKNPKPPHNLLDDFTRR
jgi:hypothetical protein